MAKIKKKKAKSQFTHVLAMFEDAYTNYEEKHRARDYENASFYRGFQYEVEEPFVEFYEDDFEAAEVQNITRQHVRAAVAETLRQLPNIQIAADNSDQGAQARARASESLCRSFIHNGTIDWDELHRCVSWSKQTGLSWLKVYWDPDAGQEIAPQEEYDLEGDEDDMVSEEGSDSIPEESDDEAAETEELDEFGHSIETRYFEGDIATMFVPTTDGLPNPDARTPKEIRHFFHVRLRTVSELEDMFPEDMFGDKMAGWDTGHQHYSQDEFNFLQDDGYYGDSEPVKADGNEMAQLVEFWEIPTKRYPNGRFALFTGKRLIYIGPNPLKPARVPFVPFLGDNLVAGSLYADGVIEDLKPLQRTINRTASKMREHLDKVTNSHLLVPLGSGIDANTWGDKPGQIIRYQAPYKPEFINPPEVPVTHFNMIQSLNDLANKISGYHDIVGQQSQGGDLSGRAIAFLKENEQAMRQPEMMTFRWAFIQVLQHALHLARQFYDEGRMIRMQGEDNRWELKAFSEGEFDFQNDLVVEVFSGAPNSPAMKFSETIEMLNNGILSDTPEGARARMMLGDGYANKSTFDHFAEHRARAKRENLIVAESWGQPIEAKLYDEHEVHLEEHNKFRVSVEYENMPPEQQALMDQHCDMHENMLAAQEQLYGESQATLAGGDMSIPPGAEMPEGAPSPMDGGQAATPDASDPMAQLPNDPAGFAGGEQQ